MSEERYDELVAAGAPRLPDGYCYWIDWSSTSGQFVVAVKPRGLYSSMITSSITWAWFTPHEDRMLRRLVRACRRSERRARTQMTNAGTRWLGRHP